jgi:hypothetical protein
MGKLSTLKRKTAAKWAESKHARNRLGQFARKNAPDLIVNTGGTVGSIIGGKLGGAVGAYAGDLIGGLVTRQVVNVSTSALSARQKLKANEVYQKAKRLQKLKMLGAATKSELKNRTEQLGDDITGDVTGWAIGNTAANVVTNTLGRSIPLSGAGVAMATVPKLVKLRRKIANSTK